MIGWCLNLTTVQFEPLMSLTHRSLTMACHFVETVKTRLTLTDFLLHQVRSEVRSSGDVV